LLDRISSHELCDRPSPDYRNGFAASLNAFYGKLMEAAKLVDRTAERSTAQGAAEACKRFWSVEVSATTY
jgi:hypothetical protein